MIADSAAASRGTSAIEATAAPVRSDAMPRAGSGWIHSAPVDLALFILSPLAGVLVVFAAQGGSLAADAPLSDWRFLWVILATNYFLQMPHYFSSFTFYLADENRAHYREHWAAYYAGPAAIFAAVLALLAAGQAAVLQSTMFLWNVYHVSLQSAGILTLYRRLGGGPNREKMPAMLAIIAVNAAMALWFVERYPPLHSLMGWLASPWILRPLLVTAAAIALWRLAAVVRAREEPFGLPELAFLVVSLALFHPYLWVRNAELATFGMLTGHFIQYLGLVWILHHRRFTAASGSLAQRALALASSRPALTVLALVASGFAFLLFHRLAYPTRVFWITANTIALVHFYLDGLHWKFRSPFVRRSVAPYLLPAVAPEREPGA